MNSFEAFEKMVGEALDKAYRDAALFGTGVVALPAAPQPSAPVVACKAPTWCGFDDAPDKDDEPRAIAYCNTDDHIYGIVAPNGWRYCSHACAAAGELPPLAAQPVEAKLLATDNAAALALYRQIEADIKQGFDSIGRNRARPAEQPKPAAKGHDFSDPYCAWRYKGAVVRLCADCGTFETTPTRECGAVGPMWRIEFERWVGKKATGILRDPATSERLPRPRLAHSMGIEDPTLPEAR